MGGRPPTNNAPDCRCGAFYDLLLDSALCIDMFFSYGYGCFFVWFIIIICLMCKNIYCCLHLQNVFTITPFSNIFWIPVGFLKTELFRNIINDSHLLNTMKDWSTRTEQRGPFRLNPIYNNPDTTVVSRRSIASHYFTHLSRTHFA